MVAVLQFLQIFPKAAFAFMGNGGGNGQKQTEPGSLLMIIEPSRLCGERAPSPQIRVNYSWALKWGPRLSTPSPLQLFTFQTQPLFWCEAAQTSSYIEETPGIQVPPSQQENIIKIFFPRLLEFFSIGKSSITAFWIRFHKRRGPQNLYDWVAPVAEIEVQWRSNFQSGSRVLKIKCYEPIVIYDIQCNVSSQSEVMPSCRLEKAVFRCAFLNQF